MVNFVFLLLTALWLFTGCVEQQPDESEQARKDFIKKYGAEDVYICNDAGFLENRYFLDSYHTTLIRNDAGVPTRCNVTNVKVNVVESVKLAK
jgi:hypothetical protein